MKKLIYVAALASLSACGYSADKFATDYADKYCQALTDCGADFTCSTGTTTTTATGTTDAFADCDFDSGAAKDCIDADWTCDDLNFPVPDASCANVYSCPATGTTTATTAG